MERQRWAARGAGAAAGVTHGAVGAVSRSEWRVVGGCRSGRTLMRRAGSGRGRDAWRRGRRSPREAAGRRLRGVDGSGGAGAVDRSVHCGL